MAEKDPLNIIITGVGGQGNVMLSQLVGQVLVRNGFHATIGETYGASQRGGAVISHLRVSRLQQYGPLIGEGQADLIIGLEPLRVLPATHLGWWAVRRLAAFVLSSPSCREASLLVVNPGCPYAGRPARWLLVSRGGLSFGERKRTDAAGRAWRSRPCRDCRAFPSSTGAQYGET